MNNVLKPKQNSCNKKFNAEVMNILIFNPINILIVLDNIENNRDIPNNTIDIIGNTL